MRQSQFMCALSESTTFPLSLCSPGYPHSNLLSLKKWDETYQPPHFVPNSPAHDLTIALTDTFSTKVFFEDLLSSEQGREIARRWRGLRQDSGDSMAFARRAKQVYEDLGVDAMTKVVIYSDGERRHEFARFEAQTHLEPNRDFASPFPPGPSPRSERGKVSRAS